VHWRAVEAQANRELGALMEEGRYFIARKQTNPSQRQQTPRAAGKKRKQRAKRALVPSAGDMALVGGEFEEEGTEWVVHDVRYEQLDGDGKDGPKDISGVIVLYFERGDADGEKGNEDAMEWSTISEVKQWITLSS